jgi:Uma2 family endonuclease
MSDTAIQTRLWSREEYDRLVSAGMFHPDERLELIEGEILQQSPQGSVHATAVTLVENALRKVFGTNYVVRVQMPLALEADSEPEADVAIVVGSPRDYRHEHPHTAELIVEVADSTLAYDRERKMKIYAHAGIPEYWILNLLDHQLEIYRQPTFKQASAPFYQEHMILTAIESVSTLRYPQHSISVAELTP